MYCNQCASSTCIHMMSNMAAQQQMGIGSMGLAQHLAFLNQQTSRIANEEIVKAYASKPQQNKKLLLLRK